MIRRHPRCRFQGSYVAIVTPFRNGKVDLAAFRELIDWHAASGTDGLVVAGTTGEGATLTEEERERLFAVAVECTRGRLSVIAGVGTNCTRTTIENARAAERGGVDGLLVVTPYYNKPTPRGLTLHFSAVAESVHLPIVLYNVPSRTGVDMSASVVGEVSRRFDHVVAVKEALPSIEKVKRLVAETPAAVLCGGNALTADFIDIGALAASGGGSKRAAAESGGARVRASSCGE